MKHYSESKEVDQISRVTGQIDELKDIMIKNIGKLIFFDCETFIQGLMDGNTLSKSVNLEQVVLRYSLSFCVRVKYPLSTGETYENIWVYCIQYLKYL